MLSTLKDILFSPVLTQYLFFPLLIIIARICDVSFATLRIILITKGLKKIAPVIAFVEVFIWIMVARNILTDDAGWEKIFAYCLGYALGTYTGIILDNKLSIGKAIVRVFVHTENEQVITDLRNHQFGVSAVDGEGKDGPIKIIFVVVNRTDIPLVMEIIKKNNPQAFFTIESVQVANAGYFNANSDSDIYTRFGKALIPWRQGK